MVSGSPEHTGTHSRQCFPFVAGPVFFFFFCDIVDVVHLVVVVDVIDVLDDVDDGNADDVDVDFDAGDINLD